AASRSRVRRGTRRGGVRPPLPARRRRSSDAGEPGTRPPPRASAGAPARAACARRLDDPVGLGGRGVRRYGIARGGVRGRLAHPRPRRRRAAARRRSRVVRDPAPITRRVGWRRGEPPGATLSREWLVTNGLGGYAAGTVAGAATR